MTLELIGWVFLASLFVSVCWLVVAVLRADR